MRPALSRPLIVATALAMADRDGLDKLTMRRLGAELGADPMAVYHYFPNKAALFDGLVEAVYAELAPPAADGASSWRQDVVGFAQALRAALLRHPAVLPAVSTRPVDSPLVLALIERVTARLVDGGVPAGTALDLVTCVAMFTIGHALAQAGEPVGGGDEPEDLDTFDLSHFPTMAAALAAGWEHDFDRQYALGLNLLLSGLVADLGLGEALSGGR